MRWSLIFLFNTLLYSGLAQSDRLLDSLVLPESIPSNKIIIGIKSDSIHPLVVHDTISWKDDTLVWRYRNYIHGVVISEYYDTVTFDDAHVKELYEQEKLFKRHHYTYQLVLGNSWDQLCLIHNGEQIFSVVYSNFMTDPTPDSKDYLLDDLIQWVYKLRVSTPDLKNPIFPNFSTD